MRAVIVVEDHPSDGDLIKQWIEKDISNTVVDVARDPDAAEKMLGDYLKMDAVVCVVLHMFFSTVFVPGGEPRGIDLMRSYPEVPIVLISGRPEARRWKARKENVPLLQLDKPKDLFAASGKAHASVEEFQRDLVDAVKCGLLVGTLRVELRRVGKQGGWPHPLFLMRTLRAALICLVFCVAYGVSKWLAFPEVAQHILLALAGVMGVHLLDRAVLYKDFRDAFESVSRHLVELSLDVRRSVEEARAKRKE